MNKIIESINDKNYYTLVFDNIWENPLSSKPTYLAVFLYILTHAYKRDKEFIFNNEKIVVKRGQWLGSMRKIAEHFGLSISSVQKICKYLKSEHIIEHQANTKFTLFTVLNYDRYQPKLNTKANTKRTPSETKDKDNKDNKEYIYKYGGTPEFKKNFLEKLEEFKSSLAEQKSVKGIYCDWQAEAFRIANKLGIELTKEYKARWLKLFKDAFSSNRRNLIYSAYSYLYDYPKKLKNEEKIKLFFWKFANPNLKAI